MLGAAKRCKRWTTHSAQFVQLLALLFSLARSALLMGPFEPLEPPAHCCDLWTLSPPPRGLERLSLPLRLSMMTSFARNKRIAPREYAKSAPQSVQLSAEKGKIDRDSEPDSGRMHSMRKSQ